MLLAGWIRGDPSLTYDNSSPKIIVCFNESFFWCSVFDTDKYLQDDPFIIPNT